MSDQDGVPDLSQISISPSASSIGGQTPTLNGTSRQRGPVPPSPLARVQSDSTARSKESESTAQPLAGSSGRSHSFAQPVAKHESSPCFIHSQLDRHGSGSLQDWLRTRSSPRPQNHHSHQPYPPRSPRHHHPAPHHRQTHYVSSPAHYGSSSSQPHVTFSHPSQSQSTSPPFPPDDSDRSSMLSGSATMDSSPLDDDEEDGQSLTRQLAETAQGVREMSKELGRTSIHSRIHHVLIVTKARDNRLIALTRELALYLMQRKPTPNPEGSNRSNSNERGIVVYVDAQLQTSKRFDAAGIQADYPELFEPIFKRRSNSNSALSAFSSVSSLSDTSKSKHEGQLRYWTAELCSTSPNLFDFVITLGGDGTVLFTSWLFQHIVPPVLPFALGSLGFLTNFDFARYKETMDRVIDDGIRVNLRMRFTCTVYRAIAPEETGQLVGGRSRKAFKKPGGDIMMSNADKRGWEALEAPSGYKDACTMTKDREIMCFSTRPVEQFEVLNDLVVDRGPSPFVSLLELFGDEQHLTTVQADGLTVSTPTGSTAYSLSAGGSLVHPQIPAILLTPICPHTLSFRPMLLPDSMELRICVPYNSRSTAWASFDGRGRVELKQGDHIKITASKYPFPTVCADKASSDWFSAISRTLRWNERDRQKSFVVVEEDQEDDIEYMKRRTSLKRTEHVNSGERRHIPEVNEDDENQFDEEDEVDEEQNEVYDIDDKSSGEHTGPSSPHSRSQDPTIPLSKISTRLNHPPHRPGVDSPDRFAMPYRAPPQISQRHLVEALAAADIKDKDGQVGDRDEIRSGRANLVLNGNHHLIPSGRSAQYPDSAETERAPDTPRAHHSKRHVDHRAKAFAFFGQDDSASDEDMHAIFSSRFTSGKGGVSPEPSFQSLIWRLKEVHPPSFSSTVTKALTAYHFSSPDCIRVLTRCATKNLTSSNMVTRPNGQAGRAGHAAQPRGRSTPKVLDPASSEDSSDEEPAYTPQHSDDELGSGSPARASSALVSPVSALTSDTPDSSSPPSPLEDEEHAAAPNKDGPRASANRTSSNTLARRRQSSVYDSDETSGPPTPLTPSTPESITHLPARDQRRGPTDSPGRSRARDASHGARGQRSQKTSHQHQDGPRREPYRSSIPERSPNSQAEMQSRRMQRSSSRSPLNTCNCWRGCGDCWTGLARWQGWQLVKAYMAYPIGVVVAGVMLAIGCTGPLAGNSWWFCSIDNTNLGGLGYCTEGSPTCTTAVAYNVKAINGNDPIVESPTIILDTLLLAFGGLGGICLAIIAYILFQYSCRGNSCEHPAQACCCCCYDQEEARPKGRDASLEMEVMRENGLVKKDWDSLPAGEKEAMFAELRFKKIFQMTVDLTVLVGGFLAVGLFAWVDVQNAQGEWGYDALFAWVVLAFLWWLGRLMYRSTTKWARTKAKSGELYSKVKESSRSAAESVQTRSRDVRDRVTNRPSPKTADVGPRRPRGR